VISELLNRGYPISLLTDQPAEEFLGNEFPRMEELKTDFAMGAIAEREPGLILSGISATGGPGIEFYLTETAKGYGEKILNNIPSVWIEDFWGVATRKGQINFSVKPNYVCAFDKFSKLLDITRLKEANIDEPTSEKFIVTGSPAFDEISNEQNGVKVREEVRNKLNLSTNETLMVYMGDAPPDDLQNLKILIENLNKQEFVGKDLALAIRIHPAVLSDGKWSKYRKEYERQFSLFKNGRLLETMGAFSVDEVGIASDLVVSPYSTEGIKAVYRGKPSLFMLLPGLGALGLKESVDLETLPVIESGASIGVFQIENMMDGLKKLLDPRYQEAMRKAAHTYHRLDGRNTRRVVELVEEILGYKK
jgi:hypothetical protein